jgi:hypothetical protein
MICTIFLRYKLRFEPCISHNKISGFLGFHSTTILAVPSE